MNSAEALAQAIDARGVAAVLHAARVADAPAESFRFWLRAIIKDDGDASKGACVVVALVDIDTGQ